MTVISKNQLPDWIDLDLDIGDIDPQWAIEFLNQDDPDEGLRDWCCWKGVDVALAEEWKTVSASVESQQRYQSLLRAYIATRKTGTALIDAARAYQ